MVQWWASYIYYGENLEMKLSEYIHSKMGPPHAITWRAHTVEKIEEWITEWRKMNETK